MVIDGGSSDRTLHVAREHRVTHFVHHTRNMGLARSFRDGVDYALANGADIVVNKDGDNQFPQDRIGDLINRSLPGTSSRGPPGPDDRALLAFQEAHAAIRGQCGEPRGQRRAVGRRERSPVLARVAVILATLTVMFGVLAAIPFGRFLILWFAGGEIAGNVQSLVFGSIMSVAALPCLALGVISDLLRTNRILLEEQLERIKAMQNRP